MQKNRVHNIEMLRLIACITIIVFHLFFPYLLGAEFWREHINLYQHLFNATRNGQKAVDFFFIFSGLFFALTFDGTKTLWQFLKKKIIRLFPVLIFMMLLAFIFSLFKIVKFDLYNNILCILGINGFGLAFSHGNIGQFWYVSAMLYVLGFYFYLLKNYDKKNVNLFAVISVVFVYTLIINGNGGKIMAPLKTIALGFNIGLLRAIGGIGVGYLIGDWYKNNIEAIKNYLPDLKMKLFLTTIEFLCLFFIVNNLLFHKLKFKNDVIFIVVFSIITILFLIKKGYISQILENKIWNTFSKYTYSIYMVHILLYRAYSKLLWKTNPEWVIAHPVLNIALALITVIMAGVAIYHLVEVPAKNYLSQNSESLAAVEREREREKISNAPRLLPVFCIRGTINEFA